MEQDLKAIISQARFVSGLCYSVENTDLSKEGFDLVFNRSTKEKGELERMVKDFLVKYSAQQHNYQEESTKGTTSLAQALTLFETAVSTKVAQECGLQDGITQHQIDLTYEKVRLARLRVLEVGNRLHTGD